MQKYLTVDRLAFGVWPTQFNPPASKDFVTSRMDAFEKYGEKHAFTSSYAVRRTIGKIRYIYNIHLYISQSLAVTL